MKRFLCNFSYNLAAGVLLLANLGFIPTNHQLLEYDSLASVIEPETQNPDSPDPDHQNDGNDGNGDDQDNDNVGKDPNEDDNPSLEDPPEPFDFQEDLIISALNPGYTVTLNNDKLSDVGEFIELLNLTDAPLVLAGYSLRYTNSSGKTNTVFTFPEGSYMTGKHLLLRYRKAPEHEQADLNYSASLAMKAGPLELYFEEDLVDTVCWTGKTGCLKEFKNDSKTTHRTTLVRNLTSGEFEHLPADDYLPEFDPRSENLVLPSDEDDPSDNLGGANDSDNSAKLAPKCRGLEFSEVLTYYDKEQSEQFIELFNPLAESINLQGCQIGYKNKLYALEGTINSGGYLTFYPHSQFSLTKNPKNPSIISLIDADGEAVDELAYPNGQKKLTSYAKIIDSTGEESWKLTYAITPGRENIYQQYRTCEEGKVINEATGNCVKATSISKSTSSTVSKLLEDCPPGKYRNPLTGRCKNIATTTSSTLKECAEGYERNPETNRCRKIKKANDGAEFAVKPVAHSDGTAFIGIGIVVIIILLGVVYVALQFRHEIIRAARKIRQRANHICQDLLARTIRRDRHK